MFFKNKVVFITGSGSGTGQATAICFAQEGANIVVVDLDEENAKITQVKCKEYGNRVLVIKTDVTKTKECKSAIEITIKEFGQLDVLVNNAGIGRVGNLMTGTIMDTYDEVMNTYLRSVILLTSLATPHLIKTIGCVLNTSSIASQLTRTSGSVPVYAISKIGVDCFTRLSALELAPFDVRVNAVNPGYVNTNIFVNSNIELNYEECINYSPLKRISDPQEIAEFYLYLASDKAKSITGSTHNIDNGMRLM